MLTIYRRHLTGCPHRGKGRSWQKCSCPIWTSGRLGRDYFRESLDTGNWEVAQAIVRKRETDFLYPVGPEAKPQLTIEQAKNTFIDDLERNPDKPAPKKNTMYKQKLLLGRLTDYATQKGLVFMSDITRETIRDFRNTWKVGLLTKIKTNERLRAFFRFHGVADVVDSIKMPKQREDDDDGNDRIKTFSPEEWARMLATCERYPASGIYGENNRVRVRAFILLMRYTGLRISDTIKLKTDRIKNGNVNLRAAKNGKRIWLPLPPQVIDALECRRRRRTGPI